MQRERGILIKLYDDETIVAVLRKHWLGLLNNFLVIMGLLIFFIVAVYLAHDSLSESFAQQALTTQCTVSSSITTNLGQGALIIFGSAYLLSVIGYTYIAWLDYYLDIFIVTNKRILRVEQIVLINQKVSETSFQHVQDVSSQVKGMLNTLLNIGTVYIETAGERENFSFSHIKDPSAVAATILELQKTMWGSEGFKSDLLNERKNEKIAMMNGEVPQKVEITPDDGDVGHLHNITEESKRYYNQDFIEKSVKEAEEDKEVIKERIVFGGNTEDIRREVIKERAIEEIEEIQRPRKPGDSYSDGRRITPEGVIWQSEQYLNYDVLNTLNAMDDYRERNF